MCTCVPVYLCVSSACRTNRILCFLCFVDRTSLYNPANKSNQLHNSALYIYFSSLHVSGNHVPIIRRNYFIYAILLSIFISLLNMFRATMCPSSGEITVSMLFCLVYLFLFSTCFGQPCDHHQEKLLYLCVTGICHSL